MVFFLIDHSHLIGGFHHSHARARTHTHTLDLNEAISSFSIERVYENRLCARVCLCELVSILESSQKQCEIKCVTKL